jgi:hypothetical protein
MEGVDFVNDVVKPLITKYQLESSLGVILLRHTHLEEGERMVEYNNVSMPSLSTSLDHPGEGAIKAVSWLVKDDDKLVPYEVAFCSFRS